MRAWAFVLAAVMGLLAMVAADGALARGPIPAIGKFRGKTSQGLPISFLAARGRVRGQEDYFYVKRVSISVRLTCEDSSTVDETLTMTSGAGPKGHVVIIGRTSQTSFTFRGIVTDGPSRFGVRWEGSFPKPKRVTGGLNVSIAQTSSGRCESRDLSWTARR